MKTSLTFILLALLCGSALSAFVAKQSVTVSGVTYSIGNNGKDCGVTRTEGGTTISWYYTTGAANSDDCVGRNIFVLGSEIGVLLSVNENAKILVAANSVSGDLLSFLVIPVVGDALVLAYIDTSSVSGTFGKFLLGITDVAVDFDAGKAAPLEYVSAAACDDKISVELTVNVKSPYGMLNRPGEPVKINGNGVKQVFNSEEGTLTSYKAADVPFCTESKETTVADKNSGIATWKLALIIALPCVAILTVVTIFLYFKTAASRKAAATTARIEKFKQLPSSPSMATEEAGINV